jgi:hypothetical protein
MNSPTKMFVILTLSGAKGKDLLLFRENSDTHAIR